ncbi:MAG: recombinase RecT [Bacteroidales bacterium]|nr:recombinase RecT [Bacteroidales bacterium]
MANLTKQNTSLSNRPKFSVALQSEGYKKLINDTLGDPKIAQRFIANISSVVSNNYQLQKCEPASILSAGFQAESLNLPLNQSLGYAYVVPYGDKAQFQLGYRGFVQLAIRSGQYLDIDVFTIKDGEYKGRDKNTGRPIFEFIEDDEVAETKEVIGYMATFTLLNGFNKQLYWSKEKTTKHAKQYSKSFGNGSKTDLWTNAFDLMAMKTVLKQLLSKYGLLSVELQQAFEADQAVIDEKGNKQYVDNSDYEEVVDTGEIIEEDSKPIKTTKKVASEPKTTIVVENEAEQDVSNLFEEAFDEEEAF